MKIRNPRYQPPATRPALDAAQRAQIGTALTEALASWPTDQETIDIHNLAVAVRAALAGTLPPDRFDGRDIERVLRELGHDVRG
ncbi:MAG: hypothetical protein ACRD1H_04130 [Vicinamibacterales bacterium]